MAVQTPKFFLNAKVQLRRDTLKNWSLKNPVLSAGEAAVVYDGQFTKLKIGDGQTEFIDLKYLNGASDEQLSIYYTKEQIDQIIKDIDISGQLSSFYTKEEINQKLDVSDQINEKVQELNGSISNLDKLIKLLQEEQQKLESRVDSRTDMTFYDSVTWNGLTNYDRVYEDVPDGLIFIYDQEQYKPPSPTPGGDGEDEEPEQTEKSSVEYDVESQTLIFTQAAVDDGYMVLTGNVSYNTETNQLEFNG